MKLASGLCIPEPLPVHTGIKGRRVHPLIRFYAEELRTSPWQPAMVQDCGYVRNLDVPYLSVTTSYGKRHKLNPVTTLWHADVDKRECDRQMPCKMLQPSHRPSANSLTLVPAGTTRYIAAGVSPQPHGAWLALRLVRQGDGIHYPVGQPLFGDSCPFLLTSVADSCSELLKLRVRSTYMSIALTGHSNAKAGSAFSEGSACRFTT